MDADPIVRVRYFDGQYLRPQDFTDEQTYHVAMRRRHNLSGHTWGIVHGLALTTEGGPPTVEPGLAVDGYGREITVPHRMPLPPLPAPQPGTDAAYAVWLCYDRTATDPPPDGYFPRGNGKTDATSYRWRELPRLQLTEADDTLDARHPPGVPDGDLDFPPQYTAPEQERPWPVLLGTINRSATTGETTVDTSRRRYAGVVAASVLHPTGAARLTLGPATPQDATLFAVYGPKDPRPHLSINHAGATTAHGGLTVDGVLHLDNGALELPPPNAPTTPPPATQAAAPTEAAEGPKAWQISTVRNGEGRELRVLLPAEPGNSLVVGAFSQDKSAFTPCLTVASDRTVTVHGTLHVQGDLVTGGATAQPPGAHPATTGDAAEPHRTPQQDARTAEALARVLAADDDLLRDTAAHLRGRYPSAVEALTRYLTRPPATPEPESHPQAEG